MTALNTNPVNDSSKMGAIAADPEYFGHGRYRVYPVHTRFDAVCWFVEDLETIDWASGCGEFIRQVETRDKAIAGLDDSVQDSLVTDYERDLTRIIKRRHCSRAEAEERIDRLGWRA